MRTLKCGSIGKLGILAGLCVHFIFQSASACTQEQVEAAEKSLVIAKQEQKSLEGELKRLPKPKGPSAEMAYNDKVKGIESAQQAVRHLEEGINRAREKQKKCSDPETSKSAVCRSRRCTY